MLAFALTIVTGAFLLFQVQPIIGKYILPWFGGAPGVWTSCLLFFQTMLLAGYAYAHGIARRLPLRAQALVQVALVAGALACLPIIPGDHWKPTGAECPTLRILRLLLANLGLPYFVLSATGPLLQHWYSRLHAGAAPYRFYALSNAGSLLALVSYPFFFEPQFTRQTQATCWAWGLGLYAMACTVCAARVGWARPAVPAIPILPSASALAASPTITKRPSTASASVRADTTIRQPDVAGGFGTRLLWLLWPACGSVLLLAITNKMCQDVAVVPFLWVLPLTLYLLSFIVCFDHPRWYARPVFGPVLVGALGAVTWTLFAGVELPLRTQIVVYSIGLFAGCMVCHGELYRLRPPPEHLTGFYLGLAAGGAFGSAFVVLVAPVVFTDYHELHVGLVACGLLFLVACARCTAAESPASWRALAVGLSVLAFAGLDRALVGLADKRPAAVGGLLPGVRLIMWGTLVLLATIWTVRGGWRTFRFWQALACGWLALGLVTLTGALWMHARQTDEHVVARARNFYGTLKLCEYHRDDPLNHYRLLQHGRITHGLQFTDPHWSRQPVSYYGEGSGIARAVQALPVRPRRIGVLGLGVGTMAAFGRSGDTVRFYEINPQVRDFALRHFTYLQDSPAQTEVVMGDARLALERESSQQFDLLVMDAFSSDAVPVHLLTREAFAIYDRHLKADGLLAVHISNRYLDLEPVVVRAARAFGYAVALIHFEERDPGDDEDDTPWWIYASSWMLLTREPAWLEAPIIQQATSPLSARADRVALWTDDYASVFPLLQKP